MMNEPINNTPSRLIKTADTHKLNGQRVCSWYSISLFEYQKMEKVTTNGIQIIPTLEPIFIQAFRLYKYRHVLPSCSNHLKVKPIKIPKVIAQTVGVGPKKKPPPSATKGISVISVCSSMMGYWIKYPVNTARSRKTPKCVSSGGMARSE